MYFIPPRSAAMTKTATVQVRIEAELKREADEVLAELGLSPSVAISMYYKQIVRTRSIPIALKVPRHGLISAIKEVRKPGFHKKTKKYRNAKELLADLKK